MGLTLLAGPANAGKVALLLERYLAALEREPFLIVPNRSDVDRVERELLQTTPALLGGMIGTFDDVFRHIIAGAADRRPEASEAQQILLLHRIVDRTSLNGFGRSARSAGFVDALRDTIRELSSGPVSPAEVDGDLARLYAAYRAELDTLGLWDREVARAHAAERVASDLDAWGGEPVFAYGFEDLTGSEWQLLEALAGRTEVTVSLPYEPGRTAFASLQPTAEDLARLAGGATEELPPRYGEIAHPALAYFERALFGQDGGAPPEQEGAIRFFEAAGARGVLELVGEEVLALIRTGTPPEQIGIVCPNVERVRAPIETAFGTLAIPYSLEAPTRLAQTAFGNALLGLLRFAWLEGGRAELFAFLRSSYSGLPRYNVDFVEGRLRGRAIASPERVEGEAEALRGSPLPLVASVRGASNPVEAVREIAGWMTQAAHGLDRPPVGEASRDDLRSHEAVTRLVGELDGWQGLVGEALRRDDVVAALERALVRPMPTAERGRVAVVDLLRARTRRFEVVFVLGLEEGTFPRRAPASPFLDDDGRRRLGGRLQRPDSVSRDRYLFYTACTRPSRRLYLVREAASDEGSPREPSPFWDEAVALFPSEEVARWTRRRPLSSLTWPLESAPSERERLRAVASLSADGSTRQEADALALANGWERRLERAHRAFERPTRLRHPTVLAEMAARTVFNVTELERFADCSSAWFIDRVIDPKTIDAEVDPKLRGSVAHSALYRFFSSLPKEIGSDRVDPSRVEDAVRLMRGCLNQALEGVRMEMTPIQRRELDQSLWRDLEHLVREEGSSDFPLEPRQFEVSFGSERSAPELQRGLPLDGGVVLSGKIDRIDVDPFSARGIVQDYKAGKHAHSAREIERELRLQIPLYMLVLRDLVGIEPLGGVYRPLGGARRARGLLREDAREDALPGFVKTDYLSEDDFWAQVDGAQEIAGRLAERIRGGDVRHDPRGGECPSWCDLWPMCRVRRS